MTTSMLLASASPRRRELLERIGISVEVQAADVDESILAGEEAAPYAERVSQAKAMRVADTNPGRWVLAADTVVEVAGTPMGKAASPEDAEAMLRCLRGRTHRVITAVALQRSGPDVKTLRCSVTTEVMMRDFSEAELQDYLKAGEWKGKAGAYAVQGMAAAFVTQVHGSITNVIGLPLAEVVVLLSSQGIVKPSFQEGVSS